MKRGDISPNSAVVREDCVVKATICDLFLSFKKVGQREIAVVRFDTHVTFEALSQLAGTIVTQLQKANVQRGDVVCIIACRSIASIAAQLAVLSLGAVCAPVDPRKGVSALRATIARLHANVVLYEAKDTDLAAALMQDRTGPILICDVADTDPPDLGSLLQKSMYWIGPEDPAMIFESPTQQVEQAGVMLSHLGICRMAAYLGRCGLKGRTVIHAAPVDDPVAVAEVFGTLLTGGTVVIASDDDPTPDQIGKVIENAGVVAAFMREDLVDRMAKRAPHHFANIAHLIICGNAPAPHLFKAIRRAAPQLRVSVAHLQSEATIIAAIQDVPVDWSGDPLPLGDSFAQGDGFVLDINDQPAPDGSVGRLALTGAGLALGYFGRPDLTAASFKRLRGGGGRVFVSSLNVYRGADGKIQRDKRSPTPCLTKDKPLAQNGFLAQNGPKTTTRTAEVIRAIWADVLRKPVMAGDQSFFDLGGTSLQFMEVYVRLQNQLGLKFDIATMFQAPRIAALAQRLDELDGAPVKDIAQNVDPIAARRAAMARTRGRQRRAS